MAAFFNFSMNGDNHGRAKRDTQLKVCNLHVSPLNSHRYMKLSSWYRPLESFFISAECLLSKHGAEAFVTKSTLYVTLAGPVTEQLYVGTGKFPFLATLIPSILIDCRFCLLRECQSVIYL